MSLKINRDEKIDQLSQDIEDIRKAMGGYHDSDLVSLAEFLNTRCREFDSIEEELEAKSKFLNISIGITITIAIITIFLGIL